MASSQVMKVPRALFNNTKGSLSALFKGSDYIGLPFFVACKQELAVAPQTLTQLVDRAASLLLLQVNHLHCGFLAYAPSLCNSINLFDHLQPQRIPLQFAWTVCTPPGSPSSIKLDDRWLATQADGPFTPKALYCLDHTAHTVPWWCWHGLVRE